ncbi:MAG: helix-turn-helix transcriptional regulator [Christensenellaceae bacterium]|nr:helix-turn-helix transcriptional regulator [Christensenellaceae bacterium]
MWEIDLSGIGKRIQDRRKHLMLTQEQLAEMMDVSIQMISNLERGNKAIRIDNLIRLSQILNTSTDYILTGKPTMEEVNSLSLRIAKLPEKERKMIELLVDYCSPENN